jgi:hypothetical protein
VPSLIRHCADDLSAGASPPCRTLQRRTLTLPAGGLHHSIANGRYSERSLAAVRFRYAHSPHRIGRHPKSQKVQGPLAKYFMAVAEPVMGDATPSVESLPDIIERQKVTQDWLSCLIGQIGQNPGIFNSQEPGVFSIGNTEEFGCFLCVAQAWSVMTSRLLTRSPRRRWRAARATR